MDRDGKVKGYIIRMPGIYSTLEFLTLLTLAPFGLVLLVIIVFFYHSNSAFLFYAGLLVVALIEVVSISYFFIIVYRHRGEFGWSIIMEGDVIRFLKDGKEVQRGMGSLKTIAIRGRDIWGRRGRNRMLEFHFDDLDFRMLFQYRWGGQRDRMGKLLTGALDRLGIRYRKDKTKGFWGWSSFGRDEIHLLH